MSKKANCVKVYKKNRAVFGAFFALYLIQKLEVEQIMSNNGHLVVAEDNNQKVGAFHIIETLHESPNANVFLAQKASQETPHLIEVVNEKAPTSPQARQEIAAQYTKIALLTAGNAEASATTDTLLDGRPYLAIPTASGQTLHAYLAQNRPLHESEALQLLQQIVQIVTTLHENLLFPQSITPHTVYREENGRLRLAGFATTLSSAEIAYRAPELQPGGPATEKSNLYNLGALAYTLLAGHPPHTLSGKWDIFAEQSKERLVPLQDVRPGLHPETYKLVRDCLWRQAWSRFDTVAELGIAIAAAQEQLASQKASAKTAVALPAQLKKKRLLWITGAAMLGLALIVAALFWRQAQPVEEETVMPISAAVVSATVTPTPTQTASAPMPTNSSNQAAAPAATATSSPTATPLPPLELMAPANNTLLTNSETIEFRWTWPAEAAPAHYFELSLEANNEPSIVATVTASMIEDNVYSWKFDTNEIQTDVTYKWQLTLREENGRLLQESESFTFRYQPATSTPAPTAIGSPTSATTATMTPEPTTTSTNTATPVTACVPTQPTGWSRYAVQADDTLFELATAAGITVEQIMAVNCLNSDALSIGQVLFLPVILTPTPTQSANTTPEATPDSGTPQPQPPTQPPPPTVRPTSTPPPVQP